jgi:hypothetical protein
MTWRIIEKRLPERDYIEQLSASDFEYQINSKGTLAGNNAYGEITAVSDDGTEMPVICGHGGSMWLCRECKNSLLSERRKEGA